MSPALTTIGKWLGAALLSLAVAALVLVASFRRVLGDSTVRNGDWITFTLAGDENAGAYAKALVALGGLLASKRQDSVYYLAAGVSGEPFRAECDYRVVGVDPDAEWWSLTAYGPDQYLIPNPASRYSFNGQNLERGADGSYTIHVSALPKELNWLPVARPTGDAAPFGFTGRHDFDLLLRIYTPARAYLEHPESGPLPRIVKDRCR